MEESFVFPGDGSTHTIGNLNIFIARPWVALFFFFKNVMESMECFLPVHFRFVVFKPHNDEILVGKIKSCSKDGVHGNNYTDFLHFYYLVETISLCFSLTWILRRCNYSTWFAAASFQIVRLLFIPLLWLFCFFNSLLCLLQRRVRTALGLGLWRSWHVLGCRWKNKVEKM